MERMKFYEFNYKLTARAGIRLPLASVLAPILYQYEDKYYDACVLYMETGKITELAFDKYSVTDIMKTMSAGFIESLMILHNMEKNPEYARLIYFPEEVE